MLDDDGDRCFPEAVYLALPLTEEILTGSIVTGKDDGQWFAVMNPACDLVVRGSNGFKTDRILLVEIEKETDVAELTIDGIGQAKKRKSKLRTLSSNNHTDYYHWLPETDSFAGGFLNFRKLSTMTEDKFDNNFKKSGIQISPFFVKDIVARFSSYCARQGQPEVEYDTFITKYTNHVQEGTS